MGFEGRVETETFGPAPFGDLVEGKTDVSGNRISTKGDGCLIYQAF